ncbi:MAG: hypothetical protein ACE5GU_13375 [Candidatus Scalinduaceae bacterium]
MVITIMAQDISTAIAIKSIMGMKVTIIIDTTVDIIDMKNTTVDITDMVITIIPGIYIDHTPIDIIDAMDASNY